MPIWRGTSSTDWNTASNWDTLAVPAAGTDAIFDALSSVAPFQCTTGNTARSCRDLITTGFTGTLTIGSTSAGFLNVFRNMTLGTAASHLNPTVSLAAINMRLSGAVITSASSAVIIPELTNSAVNQIINLVGTISILRFFPTVIALFNSSTAGTFIEIVNGGSLQGNGGPGTNVTLRINGSCVVNASGYITSGIHVLAAGSILTMNGTITVNNQTASFNFSPGTLVPGTQLFRMQNTSANVTLNMGTNSFYDMEMIGILTLQSNLNITRNLTGALNTSLSGAFDITVGGNITGPNITNFTNNRKITVTGTATGTSTVTNFSLGASPAGLTYTFEIDCGSNNFVITGTTTVLIGTVVINYLTSNSGSFTATSSLLSYTSGTLVLSMVGRGPSYSWGTLRNNSGVSRTVTLLSNVYFQTIADTSFGDNWNGVGFSLYVSGNVGSTSSVTGTSTLRFIGSSNATWTVNPGATISLFSVSFEKTGATLNILNSFTYIGGTIKWVSGAVTHGATLTLGTGTIMDTTSAVPWNNITVATGATITISSPLSILGILSLLGSATFNGVSGWTCANLISSAPGPITITLQQLITYTTTTGVGITGGTAPVGNRVTMTSSGASNAIWTLNFGATQSLIYVNGTRIDSSGGQTIWSFGVSPANIATTINWNPGVPLRTVAYTFVT